MPYGTESIGGKIFYKSLGDGPVLGNDGPVYTYAVYIQRGLYTSHGIRRDEFVKKIDMTLGDKRGWTRGYVRFHRVEHSASTLILLCEPDTVDAFCAPLQTKGEVSCRNGNRVILNVKRWKQGVPHWTGSVYTYRQMLINHEMGHRIGKGHQMCSGAGRQAPVMQQQTYGLQGCIANPWPLNFELPGKMSTTQLTISEMELE